MNLSRCKWMSALAAACGILAATAPESRADQPMPRGHYVLTAVEVTPLDRASSGGKTADIQSNTLTHWIRFHVRPKFTKVEGSETLPFKITNPTDRSKCSITVDKPIFFEGEKVPAGTNLMKFQRFDGKRYNISMSQPNPLAYGSIRINDGFLFPADTYTMTFQWETKDGAKFSDTVTVLIDLDSAKKTQ